MAERVFLQAAEIQEGRMHKKKNIKKRDTKKICEAPWLPRNRV